MVTLMAGAVAEELEEIVVRGDRDLLSQDLMQTLSVKAADSTTQVSQNRTIGDWLAAEPGMSLNGQGGLLQSYSLRGMSRSRIRTEVDGVPIITDRAAGNSASFLPPSLVRAVNAQMGGSSSLFGSDAMGGVVSVQTRQFAQLNVEGAFQSLDNASALTIGGAPRN
ncbi:MAG: TonB-dependent receptor plug domain-containing protein, partial [Proteobacteria bacterium]|nr:TonB-dependent receptor plug domain-containing protein [Pseudomonadota bacterium]